ncbi:hypothetical protein GCM10010121_085010 [Streptomyces brasiliensis]|uniref:Cupin type-2 domain-containing protein n=2 Tax=Streptomyces brasiliensis TaxID=1954 RepID=A0A917P4U0_9ACTN|nr:hypothetical protein GCM10010121_085010 [Streptomyces brasiliensis]
MFELTPQALADALGRRDAPLLPCLPGVQSRLLMHGSDTEGRFSLVQHLLDPRALGAPVHRRAREDAYVHALSGEVWALSNGEERKAAAGERIHQQRGQWHAFWNRGDEPASVLEIIAPAGFEKFFGDCGAISGPVDENVLSEMAVGYGAEFDWSATSDVVRRNALSFR